QSLQPAFKPWPSESRLGRECPREACSASVAAVHLKGRCHTTSRQCETIAGKAMAKDTEREASALKSTSRIRYEELHALLRERICMLVYPPGMTLSESELAAEFNVSRTPIRRVLQSLEAQGLVETKQSVGTIVTSVELRALREVYAVRMVLAASLGDVAAERRPEGRATAFKALRERAARLHRHRDFEEFVRINNALHNHLGLLP